MDKAPQHYRFQFSLKALLLLVTIACVFFAFPQFMLGWVGFSAAILVVLGMYFGVTYLLIKTMSFFLGKCDEDD